MNVFPKAVVMTAIGKLKILNSLFLGAAKWSQKIKFPKNLLKTNDGKNSMRFFSFSLFKQL